MTANRLLERFPMDAVSASILREVIEAMQPAEEIGGPERESYFNLMKAIETEARERRETAEKGR